MSKKKTVDVGQKRTPEEIKQTAMDYVFDIIEDFFHAAKKLQRFSNMNPNRIRFGVFMAIPEAQKIQKGDFAKKYKVNPSTVSQWRLEDDVMKVRNYIMRAYFQSKTPKVLHALLDASTTKSVFDTYNEKAIKLYLQYVEEFTEKHGLDVSNKLDPSTPVVFANLSASPFIQPDDEKEEKPKKKRATKKKKKPKPKKSPSKK